MFKPWVITEPGVAPNFLQLNRLRKALPAPLPDSYEEFLKRFNGGVPRGAPLVIPFLEIQDRVTRLRGIRAEGDPFALVPGELGDEVPNPQELLVIADTKLNNPLALCLSPNDHGAIYYILRNTGPRTSGTFALQRCWRLFDDFNELCSNLMRTETRELTPGHDVMLDLGTSRPDTDHVTGLWTRKTK
jgi:hypothetical protein